jgi:uncharacterized tellurite resistance protein B-like protein
MASDGNIDAREIALIKKLCVESEIFKGFNFIDEINILVNLINSEGKSFIRQFLSHLNDTELSSDEQLTILDFAIHTIHADDQLEYSEIKFFKNIRHRLSISDEIILNRFPDIEMFLEDDIDSENMLDLITSQYLDNIQLPQFESISIDQL